jgi:hypothetical protein
MTEKTVAGTDYRDPSRVNVYSAGILSFSDLAPFLDELNRRHMFVDAEVSSHTPPAAGFSEIALYVFLGVSSSVPVIYLKGFIEGWAEEDAKALRSHVVEILKRGWQTSWGRRFVPFTIELGKVRYRFHERVNEEQLLERIKAAAQHAASLPDEAFEGNGGPGEYGLWWDDKSKTWKGSIYGYSDDMCFPENVLGEGPGDVICREPDVWT